MGEYVKYRGEEVKIGTMENLFYVSFNKYMAALNKGALKRCPNNDDPQNYVLPDSDNRFRFPFPDEDKLPFGQIIQPYDRGITIKVDSRTIPTVSKFSLLQGSPFYEVDVVQQRLVHRQSDNRLCLALVLREKGIGLFRIEDDAAIKDFIAEIIRNNISTAKNLEDKKFLRKISARILKGYQLDYLKQKISPTKTVSLKNKDRSKGRRL